MQIPPPLHFSLATRNGSGLDVTMSCPIFSWPVRWAAIIGVVLSSLTLLGAEEAVLVRLAKHGRSPVRVLFLGNSITLHGPAPEIGWTGNWGMAASTAEADYVHLLMADMTRVLGMSPQAMVRNIAGFERGYESFDVGTGLQEAREFRADLVVVAIGENVAPLVTEDARLKFTAAFSRLLAALQVAGKPALMVRSSFWPNAVKDDILRRVSADVGATYVDIAALGRDERHAARAERKIPHDGVAAHPGDLGMRAIADAIFAAMQQPGASARPERRVESPGARLSERPPSTVGKKPEVREPMMVVVRGEAPTEVAPHQTGNVYAPEVHRDGLRWRMWYGGQGRDGHDRIHLAESTNGATWTKRGVVVDCGSANHVNDPSVVRVGELWWMFYTVAETGEWDEIAAATSPDGVVWETRGVVLKRGEGWGWDSGKVGRPSVRYEGGVFRLWYDGQPTAAAAAANPLAGMIQREGRAVGYAESPDGLVWRRWVEPVFREGAGAVHVAREGTRLVMVIESGTGTRWATSPDGLVWSSRGRLLALTGGEADRFGQVTPFLGIHGGDATLYFGAAGRKTWDGNAIARVPLSLP